jgi:cell division topological specificity factor
MSLFDFFRRPSSAPVARERLQIVLAHERGLTRGKSDLIAVLQEEILAVVARHIAVDPDNVQITLDRGDPVTMLEIDITIPGPTMARSSVAKPALRDGTTRYR